MISDVQCSDLGLYRCELYREFNCSLAYREIIEFSLLNNWQLIVAGGGGGFLLLCLITVCVYNTWMKRLRKRLNACIVYTEAHSPKLNTVATLLHNGETVDEITYTSVTHKSRKCLDSKGETVNEITYASVAPKSHNCQDSEVLVNNKPVNGSASENVNSETALYTTVKQRDKTCSK